MCVCAFQTQTPTRVACVKAPPPPAAAKSVSHPPSYPPAFTAASIIVMDAAGLLSPRCDMTECDVTHMSPPRGAEEGVVCGPEERTDRQKDYPGGEGWLMCSYRTLGSVRRTRKCSCVVCVAAGSYSCECLYVRGASAVTGPLCQMLTLWRHGAFFSPTWHSGHSVSNES